MPRRSKVYTLPEDLREELNVRLVGSGFGGYDDLSAWLESQGHGISRSALHRYGRDLQADFEAAMGEVRKTTQLAKAMTDADADEKGALVDATARIVQESLLRIALALRNAEDDPKDMARHLSQVSRALSDLGRVSLSQKKWAREVKEAILAEAAGKLGGLKSKGYDGKTLDAAIAAVYGV